ncbi:MAG TPA: hypothetical protein VGJ91_20025 [Polyangiaceae bacterium]|jgi:hypothetical protein
MNNAITTAEIVKAALALHSGRKAERCMLRHVRPMLGSTKQAQDAALLQAQREGAIVLYREDNTPALIKADHEAVLEIAGCARHLLYVM